jgi:hypothetical protein
MTAFTQRPVEEENPFQSEPVEALGETEAPLHGPGSNLGPMHGGDGLSPEQREEVRQRERDRRRLLQRVTIIPDDFQGERRGNMVTQEEFDRLANDYSSVRRGDGDLRIAETSDPRLNRSRDVALDDISRILQTPSGRGLIHALVNQPQHHRTTVSPWPEIPMPGAHADPASGGLTLSAAGTSSDGVGGPASVAYNPTHMPNGFVADPWGVFRSDVTLYHELVHAYQAGLGHDVASPAANASPRDAAAHVQDGEYQATGLGTHTNDPFSENRYRRERGNLTTDQSIAGDLGMPRRDDYTASTGVRRVPPYVEAAHRQRMQDFGIDSF